MRPRFFEIRSRLVAQPYETLRDVYQATLEKAPFLKESEGVFKVLGLRSDASFKEAARALKIWGNNVETHKEAVDYDQRHAALRQLTYIMGTPFGWANYCAYTRGREAVGQLPRGVVKDRVEELAERVMRTRANYDELLHAK